MIITSLASRCTTRFEMPMKQSTSTTTVAAPIIRRVQLRFFPKFGVPLESPASRIDRISTLLFRSLVTPHHNMTAGCLRQACKTRKRFDLFHSAAEHLILMLSELLFELHLRQLPLGLGELLPERSFRLITLTK